MRRLSRLREWVTEPMLNFKPFRSAGAMLAGVKGMHMIRKLSSRLS